MSRLPLSLLLFGLFTLSAATPPLPLITGLQACQGLPEQQRFWAENGANYRLQSGPETVTVIGRQTWGARPPLPAGRSWQAYPQDAAFCPQIQRVTVHHTHSEYTARSLQQRHQTQADPKADIGYHFLIDSEGQIYEGRPLGIIGSHSEKDNRGNIGIALSGDFQEQPPTRAQTETLRKLVMALRCPCSDWDGVWTHRSRKQLQFPDAPEHHTLCPGDVLAAEVETLAKNLDLTPKSKEISKNAPKS
jgi:hypothetical protein